MPKPINEDKKLKQVPAMVLPETVEALHVIARDREWSLSKAVRKAIETGLTTLLPSTSRRVVSRASRNKAEVS